MNCRCGVRIDSVLSLRHIITLYLHGVLHDASIFLCAHFTEGFVKATVEPYDNHPLRIPHHR